MLILARDRLRDPTAGYARRPSCASSRTASAPALERGVRIVANAGGLNPAGLADARRRAGRPARAVPARSGTSTATSCRPDGGGLGGAGRERVPGLLGDRRVPARAAPTWSSPAGSPTPRWWSGRPPGTTAGPRTTGTRWPAPTVAGHVLECGAQATGGNYAFFRELRPAARPGFPIAEVARRRLGGDHQAPRHRRRGHRGHRHRAAAVRDRPAPRYLGPDVRDPLRHVAPRRRTARTGSGSPGWPARRRRRDAQGGRGAAGRLPQRDHVRAHRAGHRGEGGAGPGPGRATRSARPAAGASGVDAGPHRPRRRGHRGGGQRAAARCPSRTPTRTRSGGPSPGRRSSWPWRRTRAST